MTAPNNPGFVTEGLEPKVYPYAKQVNADPDLNNQAVMFQTAKLDGGGSFGENDTNGLVVAALNYLFNGTDFSAEESNREITVLASAARTSTTDSANFTNISSRGAHFVINVSALAATPSITVTIQGRDPISGNFYDLLVSNAITTVGTTVLKVYPGITAVANGAANDILPRTYRVRVAHADADSITYSVSAITVR